MFSGSVSETAAKVDQAAHLIEGFETPYGLELLSTVHRASHDIGSTDLAEISAYVREWTDRKGQLFTEPHMATALLDCASTARSPPP